VEPRHLIGQPVNTDDHRGRYIGCFKDLTPLRDELTVTGEHDCLGRVWRDVHRDLPPTVVLERLGNELPRDRADSSLVLHSRARSLRASQGSYVE
jgi:hypothetical protein